MKTKGEQLIKLTQFVRFERNCKAEKKERKGGGNKKKGKYDEYRLYKLHIVFQREVSIGLRVFVFRTESVDCRNTFNFPLGYEITRSP